MKLEEIRGAVARGWCHPDNEHKIMDVDLANAIADEIFRLDDMPNLGLATTEEIINELKARAEMSKYGDNNWADYRTVD